jgi:hypothetical protein
MYAGIGQSLGSLIGGALSKRYGISKAFQYCGWLDVAMLVAFVGHQMIQKWKGEAPVTVQFDRHSEVELKKHNKPKSMPLVVWSNEKGFELFLKKLLLLVNTVLEDMRGKILLGVRDFIRFR